MLALRQQYLTPGLITYYRDPLLIVEGHMQYVWDETGKRYLDAFAGIVTVTVGHCHPHDRREGPRAGRQAAAHDDDLPAPDDRPVRQEAGRAHADGQRPVGQYFTNSGSEANEVADPVGPRVHRQSRRDRLRNGYHGGTQAHDGPHRPRHLEVQEQPADRRQARARPATATAARSGWSIPSCDVKCAHDVENVIQYETPGEIACFIGEPIQGVGGAVTPPPEYFQIVYDIVRQHGGLCIADEVQGGFGRTGHHFWGFENWGVMPDMVTMAKGIGNGAPLGACVTRPEIAEMMKNRVHFNTFGGNPICMTQGLATLEVIDAREHPAERPATSATT